MPDMRHICPKQQNPKNGCKIFCPKFWEVHGGSFFLFFHPDDESSEKKTFAKNGYGSTVSYPTIRLQIEHRREMTKSGTLVTTVKEMKTENLKNRLFSRLDHLFEKFRPIIQYDYLYPLGRLQLIVSFWSPAT